MATLLVSTNLEPSGVCVNYIGQVNGQVYHYTTFSEFLTLCENFDFYLTTYGSV